MRRTKYPKRSDTPALNGAPIQEAKFIHEYMVDFDPMAAAERAGVVSTEDDQKTKNNMVRNIFSRVRDELNEIIQDRASRLKLMDDKAVLELANVAYADPGDLFDKSGQLLALKDMPANIRRTISEIDFKATKDGRVYPSKVKLYDKMSALQTILKQQGALGADVNINYNQNNQYNQYNQQVNLNNIDLNDFSNDELQVMRKMIGDQDPQEVLDLHRLEQNV